MVSRSLPADHGQEPRVGDLLRCCRTGALLRPNVKVGGQNVKNVRASTCLFAVMCDRLLTGEGPGISRRRAQCVAPLLAGGSRAPWSTSGAHWTSGSMPLLVL